MTDSVDILFPVGRLVAGSPSEIQKVTDPVTGQPKIDQKTGLQREEYYLACAIPKGGEAKWWDTPWGQKIVQVAYAAFPGGQTQQPTFAWKIVDGDSTTPNKANKIPSQITGYAGHWVVSMKTAFQPQYKNHDGMQTITPDQFYKGCYIQCHATLAGNGATANPGIYINVDIVALSGHGERINTGPDAASLGFGGALPPGASQTPLGNPNMMNNVPQGGQQQMPQQGYYQQPAPGPTAGPAQMPAQPGPAAGGAPPAGPGAQPGYQAPASAPQNAASPSEPYYGAMGGPAPPQQ